MHEASLRIILHKLGITVARKSGEWLCCKCPFSQYFHRAGKDTHPSFAAKISYDNVSAYYCHACKMHGRISSLARALGRYRHNDQFHYQLIASEADNADRETYTYPDFDALPEIKDPPQQPLVEETYDNMYCNAVDNHEAVSYLHSRGIGNETSRKLELKWDERQRRILFPVRGIDNSLYGFSGRSIDGDSKLKIRDYTGLKKKQHILGSNRWRPDSIDKLIIVEGLFAFAHLVELNVEKVADVGALLGSYLAPQKKQLIEDRNALTYLLVDNDAAGDQFLFGRKDETGNYDLKSGAAYQLSQDLTVFVPEYPDGLTDPDQLSKRHIWDMLQYTRQWNGYYHE